MSDGCAGGTDDEDFFDQPKNRRAAGKKPAAERRPSPFTLSPSPDDVKASNRRHRGRRRSSSDESDSDHSSKERRRESDEEESCDKRSNSSSVKCAIVIPLPSDGDEDDEADSKRADGESTEEKEPVQDQPARYKKKKKPTGESKATNFGHENMNHGKKNSPHSSRLSQNKSGYSSDEEKRHLEPGCHSRTRRSASSTSINHPVGTYRVSRATSAPVRRPRLQQYRPVVGSGSRMDVNVLFKSLLHAESQLPRRKSVADPDEFRRRRNYTFNDEKLDMIERENKRLLEKIVAINYSEPTHGRRASEKRTTPVKPIAFPDNTRIKQLEKIQKDNLVRFMSAMIYECI